MHGIPGSRRLCEGDIVSIDIGAIVEGYHGDAAVTLPVGAIRAPLQALLRDTYQALYEDRASDAGNHLTDISYAVQRYVEHRGYSVVRELVGHGIGRSMHEEPQVPNYGPPGQGPVLRAGMTLAIEPMVNLGGPAIEVGPDKWTVSTADGQPSAHFEHTVAITSGEAEILTRWPDSEEPI